MRLGALLAFSRQRHYVTFFLFFFSFLFFFLTYLYARRVTLFLRANLFADLSINSVKTVTCFLHRSKMFSLVVFETVLTRLFPTFWVGTSTRSWTVFSIRRGSCPFDVSRESSGTLSRLFVDCCMVDIWRS